MRLASDNKVEPDLLETMLQGYAAEVFIVTADTLQIQRANAACVSNLQYSLKKLLALSPAEILIGKRQAGEFEKLLASFQSGKKRKASFKGDFRRKDGSTYPADVHLQAASLDGRPVIAVVAQGEREAFRAGNSTAPGLQAIISHIPGMAFQVFRSNDGVISMPYVSDKSKMLLGIEAQALSAKPERFFDLVVPEDKPSYLAALKQAGGTHLTFNWEGRIWVKDWNDIKWVSSRVSQRKVADGTMWDGIMLNITHSKEAEVEIMRSREELSALTSHVHTVKEQERLSISREIHDELGGYLTAIKIGLSWLSHNLPNEAPRLLERTVYLDSVVDRTIEAIHRIAANLRPPLVDFGIVPAIEWQARQFSQDFGIPCEFHSDEENIAMSPDASIAVLRIAQEALTNIARHAHASKVKVRMKKQGNQLSLEIADNGKGLQTSDVNPERRSFGVLGMTERAAALGGELQLNSVAGQGTTICLRLPIATDPSPAGKDGKNKKTGNKIAAALESASQPVALE